MSILNQSNHNHKRKITAFIILLILAILSFLASVAVICHQIRFQHDTFLMTKSELQYKTKKGAKDIDAIFMQAKQKVDTLASYISSGKFDQAELVQQIQSLVAENPNYYGSSITYRPFGYDATRRLYASYYHRVPGEESKFKLIQIEDLYDYTKADYDWYVRPMKEGSGWG